MIVSAEDVLPGHPDRLCDAVAETIVELALARDPEALVAVEVALHRHVLLVTGRVAAGHERVDDRFLDGGHLTSLASEVLVGAGYAERWHHGVGVVADLEVAPLGRDERVMRPYSDDQTIAVGHADPMGPALMPLEAYAARHLRAALSALRLAHPDALGPDGKVLVTVDPGEPDARATLRHVNVAVQHAAGVGYETLYALVAPAMDGALADLAPWLDAPPNLDGTTLRVNGVGDFVAGGPTVDNGLSGKKLVVDHYGPRVPIGGGALCGKDVHKADRVGPLVARQLAVRLAAATGRPATVTVGWLPGLTGPDRISAVLDDGSRLSERAIRDAVDVPDLSLAGSAARLELADVAWREAIGRGYLGSDRAWDR